MPPHRGSHENPQVNPQANRQESSQVDSQKQHLMDQAWQQLSQQEGQQQAQNQARQQVRQHVRGQVRRSASGVPDVSNHLSNDYSHHLRPFLPPSPGSRKALVAVAGGKHTPLGQSGQGAEQISQSSRRFMRSQSADLEGTEGGDSRRHSLDALGGGKRGHSRAPSIGAGTAQELRSLGVNVEEGSPWGPHLLRSPRKSCLSVGTGAGENKLKKQVPFDRMVRVRRFASFEDLAGPGSAPEG
ncbi:hypothetical protein CLOM_g31 [Closterium sp. NIES-68]|nr:hypothetical protein CLOM_g31 [Closterium sp. NIES-68]